MTTTEAIHIFEHSRLVSDNFTIAGVAAAHVYALAALRAQQAWENPEPLTVEEIQGLARQPVWAVDGAGHSDYVIIDEDGNGYDADTGLWPAYYYAMSGDGTHGLHKDGWLAYRNKPEE